MTKEDTEVVFLHTPVPLSGRGSTAEALYEGFNLLKSKSTQKHPFGPKTTPNRSPQATDALFPSKSQKMVEKNLLLLQHAGGWELFEKQAILVNNRNQITFQRRRRKF